MRIVEFLTARLDEDEQAARNAAAYHPDWRYDREKFTVRAEGYTIASEADGRPLADVDGTHIARHDPARVLRDVEAKRDRITIIDALQKTHPSVARSLLQLEARPFADHPDYAEACRP